MVSKVGNERLWDLTVFLEDWVQEFGIKENNTNVAGMVAIIKGITGSLLITKINKTITRGE